MLRLREQRLELVVFQFVDDTSRKDVSGGESIGRLVKLGLCMVFG